MKESAIEARNLTRASDVEGAIRGTYDKLEYGLTAPVSFIAAGNTAPLTCLPYRAP